MRNLFLLIVPVVFSVSCVPNDLSQENATWDSPVSYLPPPENPPPPPSDGEGRWIGPNGYEKR